MRSLDQADELMKLLLEEMAGHNVKASYSPYLALVQR
jgi:hypothetical protein